MASLDMEGAYELNSTAIDDKITRASAGNYALGHTKGSTFYVSYVGRSDSDVNARLKQHIDKHPQFKFSYASSPKAAFEKECKNFHDFGGTDALENQIHPDRPKDSVWKCPVCEIFD